jgi:hypothetical protein
MLDRKMLAQEGCEGNGCPQIERVDRDWVEVTGHDPDDPARELRVRVRRTLLHAAVAADQ